MMASAAHRLRRQPGDLQPELRRLHMQILHQQEQAERVDQVQRTTERSFISNAFAIVWSFQIQYYFYEVMVNYPGTGFTKRDKWDCLEVRLIWFAMVHAFTPVLLWITRGHGIAGSRRRNLLENAATLVGIAVFRFTAWCVSASARSNR